MKQLFTLLSIFILVGCTITKRSFNSGYHVEWKKTYSKEKNDLDRQNLTDLKDEHLIISDPYDALPVEVILKDSVQIGEVNKSDNLVPLIEEQTNISAIPSELKTNSPINMVSISDDEIPIDEQKRKVEPFTWAVLGGVVLGLLLLLTIGFTDITIAVLMGIGLLVIIFSIISIIRILKHPERYKAKGLTWTLFGLSMAGIGLALFILIWYLLLITHNIDLL